MAKITLIRHGQSLWNQQNIFTGWANVPLSDQGRQEAIAAGKTLSNDTFDLVFTSELLRAQQTAVLLLQQNNSQRTPLLMPFKSNEHPAAWHESHHDAILESCITCYTDWHLNERYYGDLQGMNKDEARQQFGEEQIHIWRRSYDIPPPQGESLKMTADRTIPFYQSHIEPQLMNEKNILISAHGNSLRSIVMQLEKMTEEQVLSLEIATGDPRSYTFNATDASYSRID